MKTKILFVPHDLEFVFIDSQSQLERNKNDPKQQAVFEVRECVVKTGPKKGKIEKKIVLWIGSHTFKKRRRLRNGNLIFTCNYLSAVVGVEDEGSGGTLGYQSWPCQTKTQRKGEFGMALSFLLYS